MYKSTIDGKYLTVQYQDTSLRLGAPQFRKLKLWLVLFVQSYEEFLWTKRKGCLGLKRPKARVELNVTLCGKSRMINLNHRFRGKKKVTDVISLQYLESHDEIETASGPFPLLLGELFLCREVTAAQARKFRLRFEEEFVHLLVHGALHVLGYDHERSAEDELLMETKEKQLLLRIRKLRLKRRLK
jgi:rRNA maturation RNase YbeY